MCRINSTVGMRWHWARSSPEKNSQSWQHTVGRARGGGFLDTPDFSLDAFSILLLYKVSLASLCSSETQLQSNNSPVLLYDNLKTAELQLAQEAATLRHVLSQPHWVIFPISCVGGTKGSWQPDPQLGWFWREVVSFHVCFCCCFAF